MQNINAVFDVTNYGACGDGKFNNTEAVAKVIALAEKEGGGVIYFPPGEYVSGTIELKSNMTLYLSAGTTILGSERREDYPMITAETLEGYTRGGHSGLIKAMNAENVTVTGRGTVDGRGYNWWDEPKNVHRPRAIQMFLCKNVRISGISIINSAMWTLHPVCCDNVTIDGITIKNPANSPNTDGINPESCRNVRIANCHVDVGDDCITLKSGTEDDLLQKQHPCENITVTNCTMINGHGGVVIGSEMSGGVRNVVISNCVFGGTDRGIRIKTRRKRGGTVEDIRVTNIMMSNVFAPFVMNGYYQCEASPDDMELFSLDKRPASSDTPVFRNIYISNVTARNVIASAAYLYGIPEMPIDGLYISDFVAEVVGTDEEVREKPIMAYHAPKTNGEGFFAANVKNASFKNMHISVKRGSAITLENAEDVAVSGLSSNTDKSEVKISGSKGVFVSSIRANPRAEGLIENTDGSDVVISGCYVGKNQKEVF